jgi:hypothetical protein
MKYRLANRGSSCKSECGGFYNFFVTFNLVVFGRTRVRIFRLLVRFCEKEEKMGYKRQKKKLIVLRSVENRAWTMVFMHLCGEKTSEAMKREKTEQHKTDKAVQTQAPCTEICQCFEQIKMTTLLSTHT